MGEETRTVNVELQLDNAWYEVVLPLSAVKKVAEKPSWWKEDHEIHRAYKTSQK